MLGVLGFRGLGFGMFCHPHCTRTHNGSGCKGLGVWGFGSRILGFGVLDFKV